MAGKSGHTRCAAGCSAVDRVSAPPGGSESRVVSGGQEVVDNALAVGRGDAPEPGEFGEQEGSDQLSLGQGQIEFAESRAGLRGVEQRVERSPIDHPGRQTRCRGRGQRRRPRDRRRDRNRDRRQRPGRRLQRTHRSSSLPPPRAGPRTGVQFPGSSVASHGRCRPAGSLTGRLRQGRVRSRSAAGIPDAGRHNIHRRGGNRRMGAGPPSLEAARYQSHQVTKVPRHQMSSPAHSRTRSHNSHPHRNSVAISERGGALTISRS